MSYAGFDNKEQWLAERRKYVTASQVAALMDDSPYGTPAKLAAKKLNPEPYQDNRYMWWGRHLEQAVGEAFGLLYGGECLVKQKWCPAAPLAATLDGWWTPAFAQEGYNPDWITWKTDIPEEVDSALEIKVSKSLAKRVSLPSHYWWQIQTQMHCAGLTQGILVAMVGVHDLRAWAVYYDELAMAAAVKKAEHFLSNMESYLDE